nr:expressed protein [Hymenolepis microstoma]
MKESNERLNIESTHSNLFETPGPKTRLQDLFCSCFRKRSKRQSKSPKANMRRLTDLLSQNDILVVPNAVMDYYKSEGLSNTPERTDSETENEENILKPEDHKKSKLLLKYFEPEINESALTLGSRRFSTYERHDLISRPIHFRL